MSRSRLLPLLCITALFAASSAFAADNKTVSLVIHAGGESANKLTLRGADARHQILVTTHAADGSLRDVTHEAKFTVTPPIAKVNGEGLLIATGNGSASVTAQTKDGHSAS